MLAFDFFTVERSFLKLLYALFLLKVGTRRGHLVGCAVRTIAAWVTQLARNLRWTLQEQGRAFRFLIHDRDAKFPSAFDTVLVSEGVGVVRTPYRARNANAHAERWAHSARVESLDHLLIASGAQLRRVLTEYIAYFGHAQPHQSPDKRCPVALSLPVLEGHVRRRDRLGGLLQ